MCGCNYKVEVTDHYEKYFTENTKMIFLEALDHYKNEDYIKADSLFTVVINNSKDKLNVSMPIDINPYYFRGHLGIELSKYERTISDLDKVVSDTTTNTDVLLVRSEAFKMLRQYDTAISICNKLLLLNVDSSIILSQRGVCYYHKKELARACNDLFYSKHHGGDTTYLNNFLNDCK